MQVSTYGPVIRGQKEVSDLPELKSQAVIRSLVWVLGFRLCSSEDHPQRLSWLFTSWYVHFGYFFFFSIFMANASLLAPALLA